MREELEKKLQVARGPTAADAPVPGVRQAAVVLLLRGGGNLHGTELLMIRRADRAGDPWSGHLALPGGRAEPGDPSLLDIALREVKEEVGIDIKRGGRILGRLSTIFPLNTRLPRISVTPFVAWAPPEAVPHPDPAEVKEAFWLPLHGLRSDARSGAVRYTIDGETGEWPAYPSPYGPIWGITERILTEFLSLSTGL